MGFATANLIQALLMTGRWDDARQAYTTAISQDDLVDDGAVAQSAALLHALSGDRAKLAAVVTTVEQWADTEDPQDRAGIATAHAAAAVSTGDHKQALHHAQQALDFGDALSLRGDAVRWAWPIAADAALALGDETEVNQLLDKLNRHRPGHLPPVLRAERLRISARLLAGESNLAASETFDAATQAFRDLASPYHLAVALLDHAEFVAAFGDSTTAQKFAAEAEAIAQRLRARPLHGRAHTLKTSIDAALISTTT
ncbi:MAG: hypothetical protein H0V48_02365 [Nocardioidaceae bacterium]|nr:hypothetical protein [Nocardioidaceae bacterium]